MSPRVRVEARDGLLTLMIQSAVVEDAGDYRILVRNPASEITSSCTLNVYETITPTATVPLFTNSIKESFASHSNQLTLECQANSSQYISSSSIKWFKNGILIDHVSSGRYSMIQQNGLIRLSIANPNETDSGEYKCEIGLLGQPICSVLQNVSVKPSIVSPVPEERRKHRQCPERATQKHLTREHGEKHAPPVALASFMKNLTVEEGNRAKFVCSIIGQVDTVEWFKDDVRLQNELDSHGCSRYRFTISDATVGLEIQDVVPSDSGFYTCTINGRRNSVTSSSKLTVYEAYKSRKKSLTYDRPPMPSSLTEFIPKDTSSKHLDHSFERLIRSSRARSPLRREFTTSHRETYLPIRDTSSITIRDNLPITMPYRSKSYHGQLNRVTHLTILSHSDDPRTDFRSVRSLSRSANNLGSSSNLRNSLTSIQSSYVNTYSRHHSHHNHHVIPRTPVQINNRSRFRVRNAYKAYRSCSANRLDDRDYYTLGSVRSYTPGARSPFTTVPQYSSKDFLSTTTFSKSLSDIRTIPSRISNEPLRPFLHESFSTRSFADSSELASHILNPDMYVRWLKNKWGIEDRLRRERSVSMRSFNDDYARSRKIYFRESSYPSRINFSRDSWQRSPFPYFSKTIKDTYNLIANELVVECRVRGEPQPTITWTKDGNFIDLNDKYQQIDQPDGVCRLVIYTPDEKDSGLYVCKAENSAGSDSTSHNVVFDGKNSYINEKTHGYFHRDPNKPQFQNQLGNHLVTAGGTIALQAEIINEPSEVRWLCEKVPIVLGEKVRSIYDHGIYTLIISEANKEQSGTYTCQAINAFGKTELQAHVHIVGPSVKGGKCPLFLSRPDNEMKIQTGDPFSFSFRLIGDPKPKLILLKGIRDITQNDRTLKEAHDDFIRFSVQNSKPNDSGTYCIVARNQHGTDRAFVTITVKERARSVIPVRSNWLNVSDEYSDVSSYLKNPPAAISSEPIVIDNGKTHLSISWQKPINVDAAPVIAYRVEAWLIGAEGGARWQELGITPINCFDAFNLKAGAQYHFRVTPRNRYGWGHSVQTSSPITVGAFATLPEFTKILPGQIKVLLGQDFFFLECIYKGKPRPHIVWYKDEIPLDQNDERITMRILGTSTCRLEIRDVQSSDSGRYTCEATNTQGRVSTFARLQAVANYRIYEVDNKLKQRINGETDITEDTLPQFAMRLRDRRIQSSYPVRLSCQAVGLPVPEITWFKDNQQLTTSERYVILNEDTFSTLEIMRATLDDSGTYTATATNEHGQISCHCSLIVDKGIRAYIAPEFLGSLEPDYNVKYGHEIRLCAQIEAYPTVGVNWYRNGAKIRPSRRIVPTLDDDGFVELVISNATFDDAGAYRCVATNVVGKAESTCNVTIDTCDSMIIPSICEPNIMPYSKEPMFIKKPRSFEAFEGDTVMIDCEILADSDQKVEVVWLRDFLKPEYYKDAPHFRRIGNGPSYCLEIPRAKLDYTGTYTVVASNCYGSTKAIISLQIYAKDLNNAMDKTKNITHGNIETLPIFKRQLKDVRCCDGDSVRLECHVESTPAPNIYWEKDGKKLQQISDDFSMSYDVGGRAILSIKRVYPEDEGEYKCVASNSIGKTFSLACIIVDVAEEKENLLSRQLTRPSGFLSANSTPLSTPRATPIRSMSPMSMTMSYRSSNMNVAQQRHNKFMSPKFYAVPHSRVAEEGETVQFQCAIAGHPTPWSTWDQDGQIVTPTTRITIKERDDLRILEIDEVTHEDAGLYRITLENEYGRIEATARLDIIGTGRSAAGRGIRTGSSPRRNISVSRRLMGSSTRIGGRLALAANFRGTSAPARKFYHNGNDVNLDDPRIKITENDANINLTIDNVQSKDEGIYTCIAENEFSIAASSVYVTLFQDESEIVKQAPEIVRSLESIQIVESGQHLDLTCQVQSFTPFEVQWKYNSKMIPANTEEYRLIDHGDGLIALRILNPLAIDSGFYICMVASEYGCCSTSCEVTIKEAEEVVRETIPIFIDEPVPVVAMHGSVVSFCARVSPSSSKVKWFVCGREITESSRGTIIESNDDGLKNLHILGVEHRHSGEIQCTIYNPLNPGLAQRSCYTDLAVLPRPIQLANVDVDPDTSPFFVHSQTVNCADLNPNTTITQQAFKPIADIPAYLIRGPDDCTALIGGTICLAVSYGGYPKPQIKWLRAGHVLTESEDIQIKIGNGSSMLILTNVQADQSGKYTVEVMNLHNCDIAAASVAVESTPDPPSGRPCISQGVDRVSIAWCGPPYDGGCIITGFILEVQQGDNDWQEYATIVDSLAYTIKDLQPNNAYRFRVRAENIHGRSEPSLCSDVVAINANNGYSTITNGLSAINLSKDYPENSDDSVDGNGIVVRQGGDFKARFVLEEELGKGRFGIVHRVVERETGQVLAAKIVKCIKAKDKLKIQEEISIMRALRHPKLLQLAAAFETSREMIMVMEYITGGELFERVVADDFTLTEHDCILFIRQICEGVDYMHSQSIVHLDLKPENIMCHTRTTHKIKIIDFGLAQRIETDSPIRVMFGTPEFISPEILNYEPIGFKSDMWSVGVICYVLLSGLSPFMGDSDVDTFANITRADYDFDDEAFDAVTQNAKDFISSLMVHRKEDRLSAKQCLESTWLSQQNDDSASKILICTDKLKKFIIRRKWQKTGNAIRALGRMATLSANSRRNSSSSNVTNNSPRPSIGNGSHITETIKPPMQPLNEVEIVSEPIPLPPPFDIQKVSVADQPDNLIHQQQPPVSEHPEAQQPAKHPPIQVSIAHRQYA